MRRRVFAISLLILVSLSGCLSLSASEADAYRKLLDDGDISGPIPYKNRTVSLILNFLVPGAGYFYLGETRVATRFLASDLVILLLNVPLSCIATFHDVDVVNQRYTVDFYIYAPERKKIADERRALAFESAVQYIAMQAEAGRTWIDEREVIHSLYIHGYQSSDLENLNWLAIQSISPIQVRFSRGSPDLPAADGETDE